MIALVEFEPCTLWETYVFTAVGASKTHTNFTFGKSLDTKQIYR